MDAKWGWPLAIMEPVTVFPPTFMVNATFIPNIIVFEAAVSDATAWKLPAGFVAAYAERPATDGPASDAERTNIVTNVDVLGDRMHESSHERPRLQTAVTTFHEDR